MYESSKTSHRHLKIRIKAKKVNRSIYGNIVFFIILISLAVFMALPLYLTLISAFKPLNELWRFPPKFYVIRPTTKNFTDLIAILSNSSSQVPLSRYFFNTVLITLLGTVGQIIVSSMCAYPLAKHKFPGNKIYSQGITLALMFSASVTAIPNYIIMSKIGWIDTYGAILVPFVGSPLGLYLIRNFIADLPDSILESARIDGASEYKIFWRLIMPNIKPAWLTVALLCVQSLWNMGANNMIYSENLKTLNYALGQILAAGVARQGAAAAVTVLMMIFPILMFIITQSNIVETMTKSGMKD